MSHHTVREIAQKIFAMAMNEEGSVQSVDIVFDQYHELSSKNPKRTLRGEQYVSSLQNITSDQFVGHFRSIMNHCANKTKFVTSLVKERKQQHYRTRLK